MRVSRTETKTSHDRIVKAAAASLRSRGVAATSIAEIMNDAGFTHGGFYKHFASKDIVLAEATAAAFAEFKDRLSSHTQTVGSKRALDNFVQYYLSREHIDNPQSGCPIAAFGTDISRSSGIIQVAYDTGYAAILAWIVENLQPPTNNAVERAETLLVLLVGTVVLARSLRAHRSSKSLIAAVQSQVAAIMYPSMK